VASINGHLERKPLGQILLERNIITEQELDLALARQKMDKGKYLGQILMEMGVPQDEIHKAMDAHQHRRKIGEVLVDTEAITPDQLEEGLQKQKEQKRDRKPLGKILLDMGYINRRQWMDALAKHFTMSIVSLKEFDASRRLQKIIGEKFALDKKIIVLQNEDGKIRLAISEPNLFFMEELQKFSPMGKRIEFYLAEPEDIPSCLGKLYARPAEPVASV
jgi:hypothetical protein